MGPCLKKKGHFRPKKQAGAELKKKKKKKRSISGQKNKLGLSLRTKKGLFWAKIVNKIKFSGKKVTNFQKKKKRTFLAKTNKLELSLRRRRRKKDFLGQKLSKKLSFKAI